MTPIRQHEVDHTIRQRISIFPEIIRYFSSVAIDYSPEVLRFRRVSNDIYRAFCVESIVKQAFNVAAE